MVEHFVGTGADADVAVDAAAGVGTAFPIGRRHGRPDSNEVVLVGASDPSRKPSLTISGRKKEKKEGIKREVSRESRIDDTIVVLLCSAVTPFRSVDLSFV